MAVQITGRRERGRVIRYIWLCLGVIFVWLLPRFPALPAQTRAILGVTFALAVLNTTLRTLLARRSGVGTSGRWGWAFTLVDVALIAAAVRVTGGLQSDLWLIYFLQVVTETLAVTPKRKLLLRVPIFAGYAVAVWPLTDFLTFSLRLFFLYAVSAVASHLYANAERRNRQLAETREQLSVAEEKNRMARELHDGLGRDIVNAILGLEVARRVAETQPAQAPALINENIAILRQAITETRELIFQTRPWAAEGEGGEPLESRLRRYASQFADRAGVTVQVDGDLGVPELAPPVAFGILRIVQEALNNVAKHAGAGQVTISLRREGKSVSVTVRDNGVGFVVGQTASSGIGLQAMSERAADFGGIVTIESALGQGTAVKLTLGV